MSIPKGRIRRQTKAGSMKLISLVSFKPESPIDHNGHMISDLVMLNARVSGPVVVAKLGLPIDC